MADIVLPPSFRPSNDGYTASLPVTFRSTELGGGAPRRRADSPTGLHRVSVTWKFDPIEYDFFMAFYRVGIKKGVLPFVMGLVIESSAILPYRCWISNEGISLSEQRGLSHVVGVTLLAEELTDVERDNYDKHLIDLYNIYNSLEDLQTVTNFLDFVVNNKLPSAQYVQPPI